MPITLEQAQAQGFNLIQQPASMGGGISPTQAQAQGYQSMQEATPVTTLPLREETKQERRDKRISKAGSRLGSIFGGDVIGEGIGTKIAKGKFARKEVEDTLTDDQKQQVAESMRRRGVSEDKIQSSVDPEVFKQEWLDQGFEGPSTKEIVGDVARVGATFIPVGKAAGVAATGLKAAGAGAGLAKFGGAVVAGAGAGYALDVSEKMRKDQENIFKPSIGTAAGAAIPFVGKGLSVAGGIGKRLVKGLGSGLAGQSSDVLEAVARNPQAARQGLRGLSGEVLEEGAETLGKQVKGMRSQANKAFGQQLDDLPKALGRPATMTKAGAKTVIKVGGKTHTLSLQGVKSELTKSLKKFDVKVSPKSTTGKARFNFSEAPLDKAESKRLQEVFDVINEWKDTSPRGFHKLSRKIGNYAKTDQTSELNAIINSVSRNTRGYIGKRVPAFQSMLDDYGKAIGEIEALEKGIGLKRGTPLNPVQVDAVKSKIRGIYSGGADEIIRPRVEALPGGSELLAKEAGRKLAAKEFAGGGLGTSIWEVLRAGTTAVIPPKLVGEIAATLGTTQPVAESFIRALRPLSQEVQIKIIQGLSVME